MLGTSIPPDMAQMTGLYTPAPRPEVLQKLVSRTEAHLKTLPDAALTQLLEDVVFQERKRLERSRETDPEEMKVLEHLGTSLVRGGRDDQIAGALPLIRAWTDEIHGRFSLPAYRFANRYFPSALSALLRPNGFLPGAATGEERIQVEGDVEFLRGLAKEATLILAPTHVSNLDSLVLGLCLSNAGLPPFQYGAGLNLFSNPLLGWWMARLGAYTVDRTKKSSLYKTILKDYSVFQLKGHHHSLFFPGGTRSRSGAIETKLKKGLLGTGLLAWQEDLSEQGPTREVYVVPCTLSFQLVLEANTLIRDHLAEQGKQRFIITDDEFVQPQRLASFMGRVLSIDSSITCRFGQPLDVLGNPVPRDHGERQAAATHRQSYVCGRDGKVEWDAQRDRIYTDRLATRLVEEYPKCATMMATHLCAWVGWRLLEQKMGTTDEYRIIRSEWGRRKLSREAYLTALTKALTQVHAGAKQGRWHTNLPEDPKQVFDIALDRFSRYHRSRALTIREGQVVVDDPRLCLYYRNRAIYADLEV